MSTNASEQQQRTLTIMHFNDAYQIDSFATEPVAGAARFATAIKQFSHLNPLVLFSGDTFNPSIMSAITRGKHMIPVLNALNVQCSVVGNHDFDFGIERLTKYVSQCNFPWLNSNAVFKSSKKPAPENALPYHIIEWNGVKIGLIGLIENWFSSIKEVDESQIDYFDFVEVGRKLARKLKSDSFNVDIVIALTHMRLHNDELLAAEVDEIDLILGGHDHFYATKRYGNKLLVKSGCDFRQLSKITLTIRYNNNSNNNNNNNNNSNSDRCECEAHLDTYSIDSSYAEDPVMKHIVSEFEEVLAAKLQTTLGETLVPLDAAASLVRTQEAAIGNFTADIIRAHMQADVGMVPGGTIRSDATYGPGKITVRDIMSLFPFDDYLMKVQVTGAQLLAAFENGVSQYPSQDGRFLHLSGASIVFDDTKPAGSRIVEAKVAGELIDSDRLYSVASVVFVLNGAAEGWGCFKTSRVLMEADTGGLLSATIINYFKSLAIVRVMKCQQAEMSVLRSVTKWKQLHRSASATELPSPQTPLSPPKSPISPSTELTTRSLARISPQVEGRVVLYSQIA